MNNRPVSPVKLTVSELKRKAMPDDPDSEQGAVQPPGPDSRPRGIDLTLVEPDQEGRRRVSGTSLGTALHTALRYLDLAAAVQNPHEAEIKRQLDAMMAAAMLTPEEHDALLLFSPALFAYVRSDLAREICAAQQCPGSSVHQEMPFTLALPARDVYPDGAGLAADDHVMVQGIIDLWYRHEGELR
jgi:ATP-dependent helicase/nuclease subunit A